MKSIFAKSHKINGFSFRLQWLYGNRIIVAFKMDQARPECSYCLLDLDLLKNIQNKPTEPYWFLGFFHASPYWEKCQASVLALSGQNNCGKFKFSKE